MAATLGKVRTLLTTTTTPTPTNTTDLGEQTRLYLTTDQDPWNNMIKLKSTGTHRTYAALRYFGQNSRFVAFRFMFQAGF